MKDQNSAAKLRQLRDQYRIPRSQISRWADVSLNTLYRWETGHREPPAWIYIVYQAYIDRFKGGAD